MNVLGISAYYHDSAAAIVHDGQVIAAAQEERFTRKKHDLQFPVNAVRWCLTANGIASKDIDYIAFYDKPFLKFDRLLETYVAFAPRGFKSFRKAMPIWVGEKLFQKRMLLQELSAIDKASAHPKSCFLLSITSVTPHRRSIRPHTTKQPSLPWTASENGLQHQQASVAVAIWRSTRKSIFPILSVYSTRRSHTTPALKSIRVNTN